MRARARSSRSLERVNEVLVESGDIGKQRLHRLHDATARNVGRMTTGNTEPPMPSQAFWGILYLDAGLAIR